ncbi:hypothetical protein EV426DRAFT_677359 [Tirmania nivea]|nr:hypothetical protein EV426DRAFT_677359 [Tirmania nivea]
MAKAKSGDNRWVQFLPIVILAMNQQIHSTTGYSPYEVVFKQKVYHLPNHLSTILDANNEEVEDDDKKAEDEDNKDNEDNQDEEEKDKEEEEEEEEDDDEEEDEQEEDDKEEDEQEEDSLNELSSQSTPIQLKLASTDIMLAKVISLVCEFLELIELLPTIAGFFVELSTSLILTDISYIVNMAYWIDTILLENWSGFLLVLDQPILSQVYSIGMAKSKTEVAT